MVAFFTIGLPMVIAMPHGWPDFSWAKTFLVTLTADVFCKLIPKPRGIAAVISHASRITLFVTEPLTGGPPSSVPGPTFPKVIPIGFQTNRLSVTTPPGRTFIPSAEALADMLPLIVTSVQSHWVYMLWLNTVSSTLATEFHPL